MRTDNFVQLLRWAISEREKIEKQQGYWTDSIMVAAWKEHLKNVREKGDRAIYLRD
jgi:hypothetical protein